MEKQITKRPKVLFETVAARVAIDQERTIPTARNGVRDGAWGPKGVESGVAGSPFTGRCCRNPVTVQDFRGERSAQNQSALEELLLVLIYRHIESKGGYESLPNAY